MDLNLFTSPSPARTRLILNLSGLLILVVGFSIAVSIWCTQDRIDREAKAKRTTTVEPLSPDDSRRYTHDVELYYGKTGLLLDKATRWLEGLAHGKPLANTIAVVSLVVAGGCFFLATVYHPEQPG